MSVPVSDMRCPYCGGNVVLREAEFIYHTWKAKRWPRLWVCENYPECDAYVSCHPGTNAPKGSLANKYLRSWRNHAHRSFDVLWKSGYKSRRAAYHWLSDKMKMTVEDCHIATFNVEQCRRVVEVCDRLKAPEVVAYRNYLKEQEEQREE